MNRTDAIAREVSKNAVHKWSVFILGSDKNARFCVSVCMPWWRWIEITPARIQIWWYGTRLLNLNRTKPVKWNICKWLQSKNEKKNYILNRRKCICCTTAVASKFKQRKVKMREKIVKNFSFFFSLFDRNDFLSLWFLINFGSWQSNI